MIGLLEGLEASFTFHAILVFFAFYPVVSSLMWTSTASIYYWRRERGRPKEPPSMNDYPFVSMLIPCHSEELHIESTLRACLELDYPRLEIVVVDDGSTDETVAKVLPFVRDKNVRLISKLTNEGKAMALNDAIPCLEGDIVVIVDADASPAPEMLLHLVPHFGSARVGAVTGNPRVVDRDTFMSRLQTIEFTSIVSLQRRAKRVWGRILTVSGVVTAFRKSALIDAGLFSPDMATEDIDMTWKLQEKYYDIRYEPGAIVWMHVPTTMGGLWRQRRRWALGLAQVLRRHTGDVLTWKRRRMWPVLVESSLSILWAYSFVFVTVVWALSVAAGLPPVGATPFPNWWGMTIATLALVQLGTGVLLDKRYDPAITRQYPVAVFYPLVYWMLMSAVTVISTPGGLRRGTRGPQLWHTTREGAAIAAPPGGPPLAIPAPAVPPSSARRVAGK